MILEKDNIKLRSLEPQDLDLLFEVENNASLWHLSNTLSPFSRFDLEQYILLSDKDIFKSKQLRLIIEANNSETVGVLDLFDFEPLHKRAGVGIIILDEYQKIGYASTALEVLIEYSKKKLQLHQLYCNIESTNINSIRLFENKGFVKAGNKKEWNFTNDEWIDEYFFQKLL